jgi:hypothetical protein
MTTEEIQSMLNCPGINDKHKAMVRMRYIEGLRPDIIAKRLGYTCASVSQLFCSLRKRVREWTEPPSAIDEAWHQRQVAYVRGLEDEHHRRRYLNGIERAHGFDVANRVDNDAS